MKIKIAKALAVAAVLTNFNQVNTALAAEGSIQNQINHLQKQLDLLQRKQEVGEEISKSNGEKFATVELNNKGLSITSPDKEYNFKLKGYAQVDSRNYIKPLDRQNDQFLVRSARVSIETKFPKNFSSRIVADFGNGQTRLVDGYADWKANDYFNVRAGKFKGPVGLERWQGETETLFVERGLTTNLVPFRDIGVGVFGEIIPQVLEYQVAVANGTVDLGDSNNDTGNGKDVSARIFTQPFKNTTISWLQGLGVGIAGSIGKKDGNTTNTDLVPAYKTTAQNNFFTYTSGVFANGKSSRINPQAWYYNGPLGVLGEYVESRNEIKRSGFAPVDLKNTAWTAIATYVLTGEDADFNGVKPKADFNPSIGKYGAFELALRAGELNIDKNTFPNFASLTSSASKIEEKVVGLNWYLNQNLKFNFDYVHNNFKNGGGTTQLSKNNEEVFLSRLQFKF